MSRFPVFPSVALTVLALVGAGAAFPGSAPAAGSTPTGTPTDAGPVTDYADAANWMVVPTTIDQPVDVFYLYPTRFQKASAGASNIATIDDAGMRQGAQGAYAIQAAMFEGIANIYAPYYRQLDAVYALTLPPADHVAAVAGAPTIDATAAFAYYIEHDNDGRPFILMGHSQGSEVANNLLAGYLQEHPDVDARMVAAYIVGYSVTLAFLAANPHLRFAERADDTGVIVSYNTEAPTIGGPNPVVLPGALVINPISWTRTETLAPASASLGSLMPDAKGGYAKVEHYADAKVDLARGVLIASTPDASVLAPGKPGGFPAGVYHPYDYPFYWFDVQANGKQRIAAYLAANGD